MFRALLFCCLEEFLPFNTSTPPPQNLTAPGSLAAEKPCAMLAFSTE